MPVSVRRVSGAVTRGHRRIRRLVLAYLDGELAPVEAARARAHLRECWDCSLDAEWTGLIKAALRRWDRRRPSQLAGRRLGELAAELSGDADPRLRRE